VDNQVPLAGDRPSMAGVGTPVDTEPMAIVVTGLTSGLTHDHLGDQLGGHHDQIHHM